MTQQLENGAGAQLETAVKLALSVSR
jgi:hypothetical protein